MIAAPDTSAVSANQKAFLVGVLVAVVSVLLFAFGFQETFYGDGPLQLQAYRTGRPTAHRLHFLLTELMAGLGLEPLQAARAASCLPAALALGAMAGMLQATHKQIGLTLAGVVVLAATPSVYFFATTIEVHGLQLLGSVVGFAAAWRAAHPRPGAGLASLAWGSVISIAALITTHPTNVLAGLGLVVLVWRGLRARGISRQAAQRIFLGIGMAAVLVALVVSKTYLDPQSARTPMNVVLPLLWEPSRTAASGLPQPLHNVLEAVIKPSGVLLILGCAGFAVARARASAPGAYALSTSSHWALWLWTLGPAVALAGPDFHENGAYFMVALPALAFGLALGARALGPSVPALLLVAVANASLTAGRMAEAKAPAPQDQQAFLAGLAEVTAGRGLYLARTQAEADLVERHLGIPTENLRYFVVLPPEERAFFLAKIGAWGRALVERGEPVFLHEDALIEAERRPALAEALSELSRDAEQVPVAATGFRGVRIE